MIGDRGDIEFRYKCSKRAKLQGVDNQILARLFQNQTSIIKYQAS